MNAYERIEEIRAAVASLRCDHRHPVQPPDGSLASPGDCSKCGTPFGRAVVAYDHLREPLAALLEAINDPYSVKSDGVILDRVTAIAIPGTAVAQAITGRTP